MPKQAAPYGGTEGSARCTAVRPHARQAARFKCDCTMLNARDGGRVADVGRRVDTRRGGA